MRAFIIAVIVVAVAGGTSHATPGQCQRTIIKEARNFTQKAMRVRQQCEGRSVSSGTYQDCEEDDPYIEFRLGKPRDKFRRHVEAACRDESLAEIGWDIVDCPGFEGACTDPITTIGGVVDCLLCINEKAESQILALYYDYLDLTTRDPSLKACQRAIGKFGASFFVDKVGALTRCELRDLSGDLPGPCPDAKTQEKVEGLMSFMQAKICSLCGGSDHDCGGSDDYGPSEIGFPTSCPAITIPGGGMLCEGTIDTLDDLASCVACLTEFKVDCLNALSVPMLEAYPPECQ